MANTPTTDSKSAVEENSFIHDFLTAKTDIKNIIKDKVVRGKNISYTYVQLDTILETINPILAAHNLLISQDVSTSDGDVSVQTTLYSTSGEHLSSGRLTFPLVNKGATPQQYGTLITYMRRYQLVAFLAIPVNDEDTDGVMPASPAQPQSDGVTPEMRQIIQRLQSMRIPRSQWPEFLSVAVNRHVEHSNEVSRQESQQILKDFDLIYRSFSSHSAGVQQQPEVADF